MKCQPWESFKTNHPRAADGVDRVWLAIRPYLPPINFITMHYAYYIFLGLLFALIFWGSSHPAQSVTFIDSLLLVVSAFTGTGLNSINLSVLTVWQQVILAIMMILGSPVLISLFTIWFRTHIFEKRFEDIVAAERNRKLKATGTVVSMAGAMFGLPVMSSFKENKRRDMMSAANRRHLQRAEADAFELSGPGHPAVTRGRDPEPMMRDTDHLNPIQEGQKLDDVSSTSGRQLSPVSHTTRRRPITRESGRHDNSGDFDFGAFVRENKKSIGRNGQFFDLDEETRERIGGVEYRALKVLFVIVGVYFVLWQVLGSIALGAWISVHGSKISAVNSQNPWWSGVFLCISSFNGSGMTLLDAGIAAFDNDAFVLTIVTILVLAGSSAFPAFLRAHVFFCSFMLKMLVAEEDYTVWKEAFEFILKYPRRLYMMMFPLRANWIFVSILSSLAVLSWVLLLVCSIGNSTMAAYDVGTQVGLALFQALALFSPGFAVISMSGLYFDVQLLFVLVMYIAAYPEIIVMRNSNVYEERSLGIYASEDSDDEDSDSSDSDSAQEKLSVPPDGPLLTPDVRAGHSRGHSVSAVSQAESKFSTTSAVSIKRLATVGRRGTAFVGKQIQRRMNNFQGVGVATKPPALKRATEINFNVGPAPAMAQEGQVSLVSQHLRGQLSHDIWFIAVALLLVTLIETSHSIVNPTSYSVFNFLFEIVSGYCNVGLSVGLPGQSFSFCGGWYTGSKLIMCAMMLRGRHRGLPVALDHSVKLPGWDNAKKQDEDAEIRRSLGRNRASMEAPV